MTMPHNPGAAKGSNTTLDTSPIDAEKQNRLSDTTSSLEETKNGATMPTEDVEKGATKPNAKAGAAAPAPPNFMDPSSFPDGGLQAWLCVLGAFCALFVSFGMLSRRTRSLGSGTNRAKAGSTVLASSKTITKLTSCHTTHQAPLHGSRHWKPASCF